MCARISSIQIQLSSSPKPSEEKVKVEFSTDGHVFMVSCSLALDAFKPIVSYVSKRCRADTYIHKTTVHDVNNLKAICNSTAAGARLKEAESLAKRSPDESRDPAQPSLLHHNFGENDDTVHESLSPLSHSCSQIAIDTQTSPIPRLKDTAATTTASIPGQGTCQGFDQERCSDSGSSVLNFPSHAEVVSNPTPSSLGDESCQIFDQERYSSSYSSLNLADTSSSFWSLEDTSQIPSDPHKHCAPISLTPSDMNEIMADDRTISIPDDWTDLPMDILGQAASGTHGGSKATSQDGIENLIMSNNDFMPSSSYPSSQSGADHEPQNVVRLGTKRMKKLDSLFETLQTASLPNITEHNEMVKEIQQLCRKGSFHQRPEALESFSADSEGLTALSSAVKFASNLLAWEKYRQEEKRLIRDENFSSISASKQVNSQMMKARRRHCKTRDWASDGRKAAKMFFDALHSRSTADRSFALLLLASNVSLDQMLKIAHFPALRSSFASRFASVVNKNVEVWSTMSSIGFAVLNVDHVVGH